MKRKKRFNKDWVDYLTDGIKLITTLFAVFTLPTTIAKLAFHDFTTTFWMLASLAWVMVTIINVWTNYENEN